MMLRPLIKIILHYLWIRRLPTQEELRDRH